MLGSSCSSGFKAWDRARLAHAGPGPALKIEVDARDPPAPALAFTDPDTLPAGQAQALVSEVGAWNARTDGPVQNVGGLHIQTSSGKRLKWQRDELELFASNATCRRASAKSLSSSTRFATEPAEQASGHLTYGNNLVGIINWGTCVIYPEGFSCDDIQASVSLRLPASGSSHRHSRTEGNKNGLVTFQTVSLMDLADCPLIAGQHLRTIPLATGPYPRPGLTCLRIAESP